MQTYRMYIDGRWREAASGEWFETHDPCTAQPWARLPRGTVADVDEAVAAAQRALRGPWRRMTATQRGALLRRLGDLTAQAA
jgi:(Z)-2-((N-methylformamido)methylene)-5-hydroxybutyrolactone dehydrogenase